MFNLLELFRNNVLMCEEHSWKIVFSSSMPEPGKDLSVLFSGLPLTLSCFRLYFYKKMGENILSLIFKIVVKVVVAISKSLASFSTFVPF